MSDTNDKDTMRAEYDLSSMRVRRVGPGRKKFNGVLVGLEPDVAAVFTDAVAVNAALRFLIKVTKDNALPEPLAATSAS